MEEVRLETEMDYLELENSLLRCGVQSQFIDEILPALKAVIATGETPHMCAVQFVTLASSLELLTQTPEGFERHAHHLRRAADSVERLAADGIRNRAAAIRAGEMEQGQGGSGAAAH